MGMYPPGQCPTVVEECPFPILPMSEVMPEMMLQGSPNKAERSENSKTGQRHIQSKRLSSQTNI